MKHNFSEIVDRIKKYKGLISDNAVAETLNLSRSAFSERKKRGSIPYEEIAIFSEHEGVSIDWLLTGEGKMLKETQPRDPIVSEIVSLLSSMDTSFKRKILKDVAGEKCLQDFEQKIGDSKEGHKSSSFKPLPEKKKTA